MATYHEYVDIHGPIRDQAIASFRLIPELAALSDAELLATTWEAYQMLVADLLDARDCPNCEGYGELDPGGGAPWILCPTCGDDGWTYGRDAVEQPHPNKNEGLPPPPGGGNPRRRPTRPTPIDTGGR